MVPEALRLQRGLELADGAGEPDVLAHMEGFADGNRARSDRLVCFAGGGAYDHEIPSVTRALAGRSEFVTSYTPYQPEVAQGVLQAVFEYQTMVARMAGLPVANASLYDGGSAAVEAVNLGVAASGRKTVWVSAGIHPHWRQMLATCAAGTGHRVPTIPLPTGVTALAGPRPGDEGRPGVVLVGYPNYLGCLEDLAAARALCDRTGALLVVGADPVAAGLLRSAGEWGADVVVGEGQVFGTTLGFGGPYLGLFACAAAHVRRLPGRLVGETVDVEGRRGLRHHPAGPRAGHPAGEGHVQRLHQPDPDGGDGRRSSSAGWAPSGLAELARRCAQATRYTRDALLGPRRGRRLRRRPRAPGVRRAPARSARRWWSSAWPMPASWPASPLGRPVRRTASTGCWSRSPNGGPATRSTPTSTALAKAVA